MFSAGTGSPDDRTFLKNDNPAVQPQYFPEDVMLAFRI
jgi:hypothetical protein